MKLHRGLSNIVLAVGLVLSAPAWAQAGGQESQVADAPAQEAGKTVEVSAVKNPALRPYRIMSRGLDAFDKHHALAPQAELRFELWNADGTIPDAQGLNLRLAGARVDLALPVDEQATFVLPRSQDAFDDNADLVLNRKKTQMRWRPRVRSPGVPENARRLGDLRLECEVSWAVTRDDMGFLMRTAVTAGGGLCHAPMIALGYRAPRPVTAVHLVSGERTQALTVQDNGRGYVLPVRDKSWNDETLVVYQFADAAPAAPAPKEEGVAAP